MSEEPGMTSTPETRAPESGDEGFTLIELLAVMIIIGILSGMAIAIFIKVPAKGYDASVKADLHSLAAEVDSYYVDQLAYPAALNLTPIGGYVTIGASSVRVSPGDSFTYELSTTGSSYCILGHNPSASQDWVWLNDSGGLQPASDTACPPPGA